MQMPLFADTETFDLAELDELIAASDELDVRFAILRVRLIQLETRLFQQSSDRLWIRLDHWRWQPPPPQLALPPGRILPALA